MCRQGNPSGALLPALSDLEEFFDDVVDIYVRKLGGGYERIAERAFGGIEADAFFLEYDSERAGGFEPLRFVPKGRHVVLGLVSTKTPVLEEKSFLRKRIEDAAKLVPLERLSISP